MINVLTWNKTCVSLILKSDAYSTFTLKDPLVVNLSSPGPLTSAMFLFLHSMREAGRGPLSPKVLFSQLCQKYVLPVSCQYLFFFFSLNLLWYVSKCTMSVVLSSTSLAFYWVVQRMSSLCFKVAGFLIALQGVVAFHEIYASALNCWHAMGFHWGLKKQKRTC